jgi:multiple sugar transport system permease protein
MNQNKKNILTAYIFTIPTLIVLAIVIFFPMLKTLYLSFFNVSFITTTPKFVGFGNYIKILSSPLFLKVMINSIIWTGVVVFFQFFFGLLVALILNRQIVGKGLIRSLILIPWVIPGVVVAIVWKLMYDPQLGIINSFLMRLGWLDSYFPWLGNEKTALLALIIVAIWKGFPFSAVMYLAALQGVDKELVEASMIDGANYFQRLIRIIIPQISSIIKLALLLTTVWTFNYFEIIYVATNGGPNNSTEIFPTIIYDTAFSQARFSFASTYAVISVLILLIFSFLYIRQLNRTGVI